MQNCQKGISTIGLLYVIVTLVGLVTIGVKLTPDYMQYYQLKGIFNSVAEEPAIRETEPSKIRTMISKRLQVNAIRDFNMDKDTFIGVDKDVLILEFSYQKKTHIFSNIDVLLTFEYTKEIK